MGIGLRGRSEAQGWGMGLRGRSEAQGWGMGLRGRSEAQGWGTGLRGPNRPSQASAAIGLEPVYLTTLENCHISKSAQAQLRT